MTTIPCAQIMQRLKIICPVEVNQHHLSLLCEMESQKYPNLSARQVWWNVIYSFVKDSEDQKLDYLCHKYFYWSKESKTQVKPSKEQIAA